MICQRAKGRTTNVWLYQPFPIPSRPWERIMMAFVMGLPQTQKEHDSVFVVVDRFSKMAYFLPCKSTNDASHDVDLFFKEVIRIHELPLNIVLDRDVKFVGHFWRTLWRKLGTNLSFSSTYNPQIDRHKKVVNRTLGNFL